MKSSPKVTEAALGPEDIDSLDRRILKALQRNNRMSMIELASAVGSTTPTCVRRVQRLRKQRAILADVSVVNPVVLGRRMTMIVEVTVEREQLDLIENFKRTIMSCAEISQCYYVTGDADFVLIVHVSDMQHYEDFISRIFQSNKNIKQFHSLISIRRVKYTTEIPID